MKLSELLATTPSIALGLNEESQAQMGYGADEYEADLTYYYNKTNAEGVESCVSLTVGCHVTHNNGNVTFHSCDIITDERQIYMECVEELDFLTDAQTHWVHALRTTPTHDGFIDGVFASVNFDKNLEHFSVEWI